MRKGDRLVKSRFLKIRFRDATIEVPAEMKSVLKLFKRREEVDPLEPVKLDSTRARRSWAKRKARALKVRLGAAPGVGGFCVARSGHAQWAHRQWVLLHVAGCPWSGRRLACNVRRAHRDNSPALRSRHGALPGIRGGLRLHANYRPALLLRGYPERYGQLGSAHGPVLLSPCPPPPLRALRSAPLLIVRAVRVLTTCAYSSHSLVCGDVGFGKTEAAMRAAFRAVDNKRQVRMVPRPLPCLPSLAQPS